jgi:type II secretory pathway component PulK
MFGAVIVGKRAAEFRQNGFVLIIVIWVMAFLSLAAIAVTRSVQAHIRQAAHQLQSRSAELLADAGVTLAMLDLTKTQSRGDARTDVGTAKSRRFPIDGSPVQCALDGAVLTISVQDTGGRISLNTGSERLLQALFLGLGLPLDGARRAADVVMDFRDADDIRRPSGAEKPEYAAARRTLGAKNEPFDALEELHQVLGLDAPVISAMKPHVTVHSGTAGLDPRVTSTALAEIVVRGAALLPNAPLTTPSFGDQKATVPNEFAIGSPQRSFNITVSAEVPGGTVFVRDAVVELSQGRNASPNIKLWRRGPRPIGAPAATPPPNC